METRIIETFTCKRYRSYPTYEEWKPLKMIATCCSISCSYPTYEEWKHFEYFANHFCHFILFLSYLWGMETPYRNGIFFHLFLQFLSYLWGMETTNNSIDTEWKNLCSYPTYEEWKQVWYSKRWLGYFMFLSYLWGMETLKASMK